MAEAEGITRGQSAWGEPITIYLTYGLILNLMSNVIALRISDKVQPGSRVFVYASAELRLEIQFGHFIEAN